MASYVSEINKTTLKIVFYNSPKFISSRLEHKTDFIMKKVPILHLIYLCYKN